MWLDWMECGGIIRRHVRRHHTHRDSPPAILLREGYREGGKVKTRTLANLSKDGDVGSMAEPHISPGGTSAKAFRVTE